MDIILSTTFQTVSQNVETESWTLTPLILSIVMIKIRTTLMDAQANAESKKGILATTPQAFACQNAEMESKLLMRVVMTEMF